MFRCTFGIVKTSPGLAAAPTVTSAFLMVICSACCVLGVPQRFVGASVVVQDDLTLDADSADIDGYRLGRAKRIILGGLRGSASGAGS